MTEFLGVDLIVWIVAALGIGISVFLLVSTTRRIPAKRVELLRPRDHRGEELKIEKETIVGVQCKPEKGSVMRFLKYGPSYVFNLGGKMLTRFYGIEGSVYTVRMEYLNSIQQSLEKHLRFLWGDAEYNKMPQPLRKAVEDDRVGVTISFDMPTQTTGGDGEIATGLSSQYLNEESDATILGQIAEKTKPSTKREFYQLLTGMGLGFGVCLFLLRMKWI